MVLHGSLRFTPLQGGNIYSCVVTLAGGGVAVVYRCASADQNSEEIREAEGCTPPTLPGENTLCRTQGWL